MNWESKWDGNELHVYPPSPKPHNISPYCFCKPAKWKSKRTGILFIHRDAPDWDKPRTLQ